MFDADDTEAVSSPPETSATIELASDDAVQLENISPIELTHNQSDDEPSPEEIKIPSVVSSKHEDGKISTNSKEDGKTSEKGGEQTKGSEKTMQKNLQTCPPPKSRCRARSRDMRQCKKHFREMIGKHEIRNDELEQRETDLRQRLEMLECSMPAVMVWNIWRMAQGAPVSHIHDVVAKQFLEPPGGFPKCPSTPSQHWDCRVREVEAERKQARNRAEEARQTFAVKDDALKFQKQQIEEAKKLHEERKMQITKLEEEVKRLQDALKKAQGDDNSCETGECGEIKCRQMWLQGTSSISSIHSTDLECLARLQDLAEAELCMKQQIADLERRECAYMRTLQQADEMWAKMENDNASSIGDLKEQLDAKIAANQQLADRIVELEDEIEKLRMQLTKASAALEEYTDKTFADVGLGEEDISTKEEIEQTEEVDKIEIAEKNELEKTKSTEEERGVAESDELEEEQKQQDKTIEYAPTEVIEPVQPELSKFKEEKVVSNTVETKIEYGTAEDEKSEKISIASNISTVEESVQVKPDFKEIETQSLAEEPELEKESTIDEKIQVEITTKETATVTKVKQENELPEAKDQGSSAHLPKNPTKDKIVETSATAEAVENFAEQKIIPSVTSKITTEPTIEQTPISATKMIAESMLKPTSETTSSQNLNVEVPNGTFSESVPEVPPSLPLYKTSDNDLGSMKIVPTVSPESFTESLPVLPSVPVIETFPEPAVETIPEKAVELLIKPAINSTETPSLESAIEGTREPVLDQTSGVTSETAVKDTVKPTMMKIESSPHASAVSIETLISWHNIAACVHKLVSICPQCSSSSAEVGKLLQEIKTYLGKDAPDQTEIECVQSGGKIPNSIAVPNKKGPCICKPKTCPLGGSPAVVLPQASVRIQTVADGQSQTSMPVKIPSREIRSPKSSKDSTKSKDEVKLTSIEEGTEPDRGIQRAGSILEGKDEATITVGEIGSQTETMRKVVSGTEDDEKLCVCPTGVCPKKKVKPPCGGFIPGKVCTSTEISQTRGYKSTADAILAPAITAIPSNESGPSASNVKNYDKISESGSFACCLCGKLLTPVASRKKTSIPLPMKPSSQNKSELTCESSDDFLCCACKAKGSSTSKPKKYLPGKSNEKSVSSARVLNRVKLTSGTVKTSCSREICCPCDEQETHVITKLLSTGSEPSKSKVKPETKDVCCLAKISRDKALKGETRRRKDKDSIKLTTPSISHNSSAQMSTNSSSYKISKTTDSSDSNVCCSSIEQVIAMMKKKSKGNKCACDSKDGKDKKEKCACNKDSESKLTNELELKKSKNVEKVKQADSKVSCLCQSAKLFD